MAKKKIIISSAGGIAAGTPFVLGGYLFVQQATPPVAASGRLVQLSDAMQSITAKGLTAATKTFVLGKNVAEGANSGSSLYVGEEITAASGVAVVADRQILFGVGISQTALFTNVDLTILLGNNPTFGTLDGGGALSGQFGNSVYLGHNQVITGLGYTDTHGGVLIGNSATIRGTNTVGIGTLVVAAGDSTCIGKSGQTAIQGTGVGQVCNVDLRGSALGHRARTGTDGVAIGFFADALGSANSIVIGRDAVAGAFTSVCLIGRGTVCFENNCFALGGDPTNGAEMQVLRLGPNTLAGYAGLSVFLPSAAAGNNIAAPNTTFRGGISTGNSVTGGRITFQSSTQGAGGGAYQAIVDRFRIAPGGVAGLPTLEFVNQISTPGGAAGTLLNAPVAGNPTIWAEVLYNGVLHFIPMW
jgi:hypothetical protein